MTSHPATCMQAFHVHTHTHQLLFTEEPCAASESDFGDLLRAIGQAALGAGKGRRTSEYPLSTQKLSEWALKPWQRF